MVEANMRDSGKSLVRLKWLDAAKAAAITLVVIGHVVRGLHDANIITNEAVFDMADGAIYMFHMPLFFFISGLTFSGASRPWPIFMRRILHVIAIPYFIWSAILILIQIKAGSAANSLATISDILRTPYKPYSIFWFLYTLFFVQLFARIFVPIKYGKSMFLAASVVGFTYNFVILGNDAKIISAILTFCLFFAVGIFMRSITLSSAPKNDPGTLIACIGVFIALELLGLYLDIAPESWAGRMIGMLISISIITIFKISYESFKCNALNLIGERTMPIYCMHTIFTAGTRIVLIKVGITSPSLHFLVGISAGMVIPLIMYYIFSIMGVSSALGLGNTPKKDNYRKAC